jgi:hypothetical protein
MVDEESDERLVSEFHLVHLGSLLCAPFLLPTAFSPPPLPTQLISPVGYCTTSSNGYFATN